MKFKMKIKARKNWGELNPVTRVAPSKRDKVRYTRQITKSDLRKLTYLPDKFFAK